MRGLGKRQFELLASWAPSLMGFGAAGTTALLYFTDWKLVLQYVPIYNTKFHKEE